MASNWLWDFLTEKNKALDKAYLKAGNLDAQLAAANRLDAQHDVDRGIKVHTIPRDTRSQLATINKEIKTDNQARTDLLEKTKPKENNLSTNFAGGSIPNTNERNTSSNPVKIPEVEKGGTRWVGGNSTWVGRDGNVIMPNIKDLPKEQVPSVLRSDGKGLESVSKIQKQVAQNPGIIESLKIKGTELFNQGKETISNAIASLPKAEQLKKVGMFDGTKAGTVKGLNTASAIIGALDAVMKKNKKPSTAGMEGKGGDIGQVAVGAGIDPEDFYRAV